MAKPRATNRTPPTPGGKNVLVQLAPHRRVANARNNAALLRFAHDIGATVARQRQPARAGSSQARALICTTSSGGKDPRVARARAPAP